MSLYEARLLPLRFISHFAAREVRGPKSPSGRLDLFRPIRAGEGLSWTHMNWN